MRLTRKLIEDGRTPLGAFNIAQLKALGATLPANGGFPAAGWIERMIGMEISESAYSTFLAMASASPGERRALFPSTRKSKGQRYEALREQRRAVNQLPLL